jgi:hypothetical protein
LLSKLEAIPNLFVIGIGHKCRHGKDTTANHIVRQTKGAARIFSLADDVYAIARVIFGMTHKNGSMLQWIGTEGFRSKDPQTWINSLYWNMYNKRPQIAVIPDVRFPNEAQFVKDMGGVIINVSRFNSDGSPFVATDRDPNHPSEVALDGYDKWDYKLQNYNIARLKKDVDNVLWDLRDKIGSEF